MEDLGIDYLKKIFSYNADRGLIFWKTGAGCVLAGAVAGCKSKDGYIVVRHAGRQYRAHRIIWALHYSAWPERDLDHINCNKSDNRIVNLRPCDNTQNQWNVSPKDGSSAHKGVGRHRDKWRARIRVGDGRRIELGAFATEEAAAEAYRSAALSYHGEFSRV